MSETRAAAERLRKHKQANECGLFSTSPYYEPLAFRGYLHQLDEDRELLAYTYLAEHPADDGEVLDQKWVFSTFRITINGAELAERFSLKRSRKGWGVYIINEINEYGEVMDDRLLVYTKTRGDVRRLCAALGVELKEAT